MRHRVGQLVGEGRGHVGAGAIRPDPDRRGLMEVVAVSVAEGERIASARGNHQLEGAGVGEHGLPESPGEDLVAAGRVAVGRLPRVRVTGDGVRLADIEDRDRCKADTLLDLERAGLVEGGFPLPGSRG